MIDILVAPETEGRPGRGQKVPMLGLMRFMTCEAIALIHRMVRKCVVHFIVASYAKLLGGLCFDKALPIAAVGIVAIHACTELERLMDRLGRIIKVVAGKTTLGISRRGKELVIA